MSTTFPLRLPPSLKADVERLAKQDGVSINQFLIMAAAQKVAALETERFFADKRERAQAVDARKTLVRLLDPKRPKQQPPQAGDEIPS